MSPTTWDPEEGGWRNKNGIPLFQEQSRFLKSNWFWEIFKSPAAEWGKLY